MAPLGLRKSKVFHIIYNKSTMGKSNVWFNGVISLSKMFSHGKLTPHGLKLNNFAKSLILMSLIKIIN